MMESMPLLKLSRSASFILWSAGVWGGVGSGATDGICELQNMQLWQSTLSEASPSLCVLRGPRQSMACMVRHRHWWASSYQALPCMLALPHPRG